MIARVAAMAGVLLVAMLVDTVVISRLPFALWRPDLVMVTVMAFALAGGPGTGARYGFAAGLLSDLVASTSRLLGSSSLVLLLLGYVLGALRPYLANTAVVGHVVAVALTSAAAVLGRSLLDQLLDVASPGLFVMVQSAAATGLVHGLLTPVVIIPLEAAFRRIPGGPGAERASSVWQRP